MPAFRRRSLPPSFSSGEGTATRRLRQVPSVKGLPHDGYAATLFAINGKTAENTVCVNYFSRELFVYW